MKEIQKEKENLMGGREQLTEKRGSRNSTRAKKQKGTARSLTLSNM